jgi:hypothetical protein
LVYFGQDLNEWDWYKYCGNAWDETLATKERVLKSAKTMH